MKGYRLATALLALPFAVGAEPLEDTALAKAVAGQFPNGKILTQSSECENSGGPSQVGLIVEQGAKLHAVVAVAAPGGWAISDLPRSIDYAGGTVMNFLAEFNSAETMSRMEVRCISPKTDKEINTRANGEFIAHRGEQSSTKHLCFPASATYNNWVCYQTKAATTKPELSFVQFNAD